MESRDVRPRRDRVRRRRLRPQHPGDGRHQARWLEARGHRPGHRRLPQDQRQVADRAGTRLGAGRSHHHEARPHLSAVARRPLAALNPLFLAEAGTQGFYRRTPRPAEKAWAPAFAGESGFRVPSAAAWIAASWPARPGAAASNAPSTAAVPTVKPCAPASRTASILAGRSIEPATTTGLPAAAHTARISAMPSRLER